MILIEAGLKINKIFETLRLTSYETTHALWWDKRSRFYAGCRGVLFLVLQ